MEQKNAKMIPLRKDLQAIAEIIDFDSKVLDIGCGEGDLLVYLKEKKNAIVRGIEIDQKKVTHAVGYGISVLQGDADSDLVHYPSKLVDYAILSQTLQVTKDPCEVLRQMLRIANYAIVSVPNFGYFKNRFYLGFKGRMPVTRKLNYEWYETPNIHFCTIKDFAILCKQMNVVVESALYQRGDKVLPIKGRGEVANLFGEVGIFLLRSAETEFDSETKEKLKVDSEKAGKKLQGSIEKPAYASVKS